MGRITQPYRRSVANSIGAGMASLFAGSQKHYYILEHRVSSKYHKAGEAQEIIVDQIELGRDSKCQVRFDESFDTVSRRHAAIVKDGDRWKLVQLSNTNSTLLNGQKIRHEWYLQNGDEIQLAINGPKLGFIIPAGSKATVGSIGLSRRLSLFRQQALRPYKQAIAVLACIVVVSVIGLTAWALSLQNDLIDQSNKLAQQIEVSEENKQLADSLAQELLVNNKKLEDNKKRLEELRINAANALKTAMDAKEAAENVQIGSTPADITECYPYTYYIQVAIYLDRQYCGTGTGTGFLLKDGRFVTAQHVVALWHGIEENLLPLNIFAHNGGDIVFKLTAISNTNDKIEMEYTPSSNPFTMGAYDLKTGTVVVAGVPRVVKYHPECDYRDYAYIQTNKTGGLDFDEAFSQSMPAKTHLDILGFPQSVGAEDTSNITPIYNESSVARDGLDVDGCILLSNSESDHGNSGGPVFAYKDGGYKVVGILSGANRLGSKFAEKPNPDAKWKGRVVPIAAAK